MDPPSSVLVGDGMNTSRQTRNRGFSLSLERMSLQITLDEKSNRDVSGTAVEDAEDKPSEHAIFPVGQLDESDPNFDDDKESIIQRWGDIVEAAVARLSVEDRETAAKYCNRQDLAVEIQAKIEDSMSVEAVKSQMARIQSLPDVMDSLMRKISGLLIPSEVNYDIIWGLLYINLKLSYSCQDRLKHTIDLLNKPRRVIELFGRCLELCNEPDEARITAMDILDSMTMVLTDSIIFLRKYPSDSEAEAAWSDLDKSINSQLSIMNQSLKHIRDVTTISKANTDRKVKDFSRHPFVPLQASLFPIRKVPFPQNPNFFERKEELNRIFECLSPKTTEDNETLRIYAIYGRRGIGKTELALQFAYTCTAGCDAVFWVQCETPLAIRQSFTNIAVSLNLPGADKVGHHEENLIAVHDWLKNTRRRWLLIFDNAEKHEILNGYWPHGAAGAILTTSRKYHNFNRDSVRKGDTIRPFDRQESWKYLLQLLGDDWQKMDQEGKIPASEIAAGKKLLEKLEGHPLAIQQAAILIKDTEIGDPTIAKTFETFKQKSRTLPERHYLARSTAERSLDVLWDMTFCWLTHNARALLGVLAWLSPDTIPAELFTPKDQAALDGELGFCKKDGVHMENHNDASPETISTPSRAFEEAMKELVKRELVKQDGKIFSIHRAVQEAVNYHDVDDLQNSFNIASRLAYEAFPKRQMNKALYEKWSQCQEYIPHGVHLSRKFSDYAASGTLKGSTFFVKLLSSCAWYLLEISEYDVCGRVINTAKSACENRMSLDFGELCNTDGGRCIALNLLSECRAAFEETLQIWQRLLPSNHPGMASIYSNLGNLELATGNAEKASECFDQSVKLWKEGGEATAFNLALTYLNIARLQKLRGQLDAAMETTMLSESLFKRTMGQDKGFMANVHYEYGNIHKRRHHWELATRSYNDCLKICLSNMPVHALTAACYYSLASVEFILNHQEVAKVYLDRARVITELRSPNRDDGPTARILWRTSLVLESDGQHAKEAAELRTRADTARQLLIAAGEGGALPCNNEDESERDDEKDSYDVLVPLFYR